MPGYGSDSGFTDWLAENGLTLPPDSPAAAVLRLRGASYVDAIYGPRLYCSAPAGGVTQERAWPRTGHSYPAGVAISDSDVPAAWVAASYRAAYLEASLTGGLSATVDPNKKIKRQKADVFEREYFENKGAEAGSGGLAVLDSQIDGLVSPFLCPKRDGKGLGIWAIGSG